MNMEPKNMMMGNMNNINQPIKTEITVNVKLENNKIISVKCFEDDMASIFRKKCKINKEYLSLDNYKMIGENLTVKENGITDYSEIHEVSIFFNIIFETNRGQNYIIALDGNCPVGMSIIHFFIRTNLSEIIQAFNNKICFFFNGTLLRIIDSTPIKKMFNGQNPKVFVSY